MTRLLSIRNLSRRFAATGDAAVEDLSLDLDAGEIMALIGPSGCGKTTTLRMIAGFETPDSGSISVQGRDVTGLAAERRGIGMVFQDYALFPHMTVAENIGFAARDGARGASPVVARYLAMVGLEGYGARYPDELSGGQQQRVALARSFAAGPGLILLDEPFSNLDAGLRSATRREIRAILKATGIGIVFVTHDQEEALSFADRLGVMQAGRIVQQGTPQEVYDHPQTAFVAGFLGRTNLIPGMAKGNVAMTRIGAMPLSQPGEGPVLLSLRPEQIAIEPAGADAAQDGARVTGCEFKGHDLTHWIRWNGLDLQVDAMGAARLAEDTPVMVKLLGPPALVTG